MYHKVQIQVFFAFESLHAYAANVRSLRTVAQLVSFQVLFALQTGAANVANVPSFDLVHGQMLLEIALVWIGHLTLWTTEQYRAVQSGRNVYLTRFLGFRLWRLFLVFTLLFHLGRCWR